MQERLQKISESLDVETIQKIDQRCLEFEADRRRQQQEVQPQAYLRGFLGDARRLLLFELLVLHFSYARGERSQALLDVLCAEFPDEFELISFAFERSRQRSGQQSTVAENETSGTTAHPEIPERLGRYQIIGELGKGGMGRVFRARDTRLNRDVALKIPALPRTGGDEYLKRFKRETRAAAALQHPGLCPVLDVARHEGILFQTAVLIEGRSLQEILDEGQKLSRTRALEIVYQIAIALTEAHRLGVVHRDIKPSNIIMTPVGQPVVIDFGLAKISSDADSFQTHEGTPVGTLSYMPPEQVQGLSQAADPRSDVYSLGILLYQLLTGHVPFEGPVRELFTRIVEEAPGPPSRYQRGLSGELDRICLQAIAKNPDDRFQSMEEFAAAIRTFASQSRLRQFKTSSGPADAGRPVAQYIMWSLIAVLLLLVALNWPPGLNEPPSEPAAVPIADDRLLDPDPAPVAPEPAVAIASTLAPDKVAYPDVSGVWRIPAGIPKTEIYGVVQQREGEPHCALLVDQGDQGKFVLPLISEVIASDERSLELRAKVAHYEISGLQQQTPAFNLQVLLQRDQFPSMVANGPDPEVQAGPPAAQRDQLILRIDPHSSKPEDDAHIAPNEQQKMLVRAERTDETLVMWQALELLAAGVPVEQAEFEAEQAMSAIALRQSHLLIESLGQRDEVGDANEELQQIENSLPVLADVQLELMDRAEAAGFELLIAQGPQDAQVVSAHVDGQRADLGALQRLAAIDSLSLIELEHVKVTDDVIRVLSEMKQLKGVEFHDCEVPAESVPNLRASRPDLRVAVQLVSAEPQLIGLDENPVPPPAWPVDPLPLELVPGDADGLAFIRNMERFSSSLDFFWKAAGQPAPDVLNSTIKRTNLNAGMDREGALLWVFKRRPGSGGLAKLVFLPTTDFKQVVRCLRAKRDRDQPELYRFQVRTGDKMARMELVGKMLPGTGYSVYAAALDENLLRDYEPPVLPVPLALRMKRWLRSQEIGLILRSDAIEAFALNSARSLEGMIPMLDSAQQEHLERVHYVLTLLQRQALRIDSGMFSHWAIGAAVRQTEGIAVSTHGTLVATEQLAAIHEAVLNTEYLPGIPRDRVLNGLPDEGFALILGGPAIAPLKEYVKAVATSKSIVDTVFHQSILQLVEHADEATLCIGAAPKEPMNPNVQLLLRGRDAGRLQEAFADLLAAIAVRFNKQFPEHQVARLDREFRDGLDILSLRLSAPLMVDLIQDGLANLLVAKNALTCFVAPVSQHSTAVVFDSVDRLKQLRSHSANSTGLVRNERVRGTLRMLPVSSQWLILIDLHESARWIARIMELTEILAVEELSDCGPLAVGAELGAEHFTLTVVVPTSVFHAVRAAVGLELIEKPQ